MKHRQARPQQRRKREKTELKSFFAQPAPTFYRLPDLELRGGRVLTDGCRRVLDFTPQKLSLDMGRAVITFYGTELKIESLAGKRLVVAGKITRMEFAQKWEGQDDPL